MSDFMHGLEKIKPAVMCLCTLAAGFAFLAFMLPLDKFFGLFLVQRHVYRDGYGNRGANHRVVAHAEEAHHLNVCRH